MNATMRKLLLCFALVVPLAHADASCLEQGYRHLYNLEFDQAHNAFREWSRLHPEDPMGPVSDAAAYLFAEFDRLHILQSEFFMEDSNFTNSSRPTPDPAVKRAFEAALAKAQQLADRALARDAGDRNAVFTAILRLGLHADYLALIEKKYLASLGEMKQGRAMAEHLLAGDPSYYDAYVAIGVENYLLSLKPAPVRWFLRMGGAQTDKRTGVEKLKLTAERGRFLQPYARMLLAVAALRDNDKTGARNLLAGLAHEFPRNPLYSQELARLE